MTEAPAGLSWAEAKAAHRNTHVAVRVAMRGDLLAEYERLVRELDKAVAFDEQTNAPDTAPAIAERVQALESEMAATEVEFVFAGVGRGLYARLLAENTAEPGSDMPWNPDTFPPALMAASCVEPAELAGNDKEWLEIHESWSDGQNTRLWNACLAANQAVVTGVPKSRVASAILGQLSSGTSSISAAG